MIYASTACLRGTARLSDRLDAYEQSGIHAVELGFAVECPDDVLTPLLDRRDRMSFLIHNYFPPPRSEFVLNLASADAAVRGRSLALVRRAIDLSAALGAEVYSVHGGFAADPIGADRWGFTFPPVSSAEWAASQVRFHEAVASLLPHARATGVRLLIENNVCMPSHRGKLLCQLPEEFVAVMEACGREGIGVLLDTGHLRVTASTFQRDLSALVRDFAPMVGLLHLHENDGTADQHRAVTVEGDVWRAVTAAGLVSTPSVVEAKFASEQDVAGHIAALMEWRLISGDRADGGHASA